jgi:hypothetical protein
LSVIAGSENSVKFSRRLLSHLPRIITSFDTPAARPHAVAFRPAADGKTRLAMSNELID